PVSRIPLPQSGPPASVQSVHVTGSPPSPASGSVSTGTLPSSRVTPPLPVLPPVLVAPAPPMRLSSEWPSSGPQLVVISQAGPSAAPSHIHPNARANETSEWK